MSDEGLDNLFKKGLSGKDVKFNMASWRAMEQMLPPEPVVSSFKMGTAATIIGVLLVISTAVFIWEWDGNTVVGNANIEGDSHNISERNSAKHMDTEMNPVYAEVKLTNQAINTKKQNGDLSSASVGFSEPTQGSEVNAEMGGTSDVKRYSQNDKLEAVGNKPEKSKASNINQSNEFFNQNSGFESMTEHKQQRGASDVSVKENHIAFNKGAFTKILGLAELSSLTNILDEETILFADVSENGLPTVKKNTFGFIGGINLNKSLIENTGSGIAGSEFFGLTYQRYLKGGFSINANLLYSARNEVNTRKVYKAKVYDFGSKTEQTTVETQRLVYLELPVMMNYGFGNHNVMAGASFSYLLSGLNKVTTDYTSLTEGSSSEEKSEWGYTNGFKSYDIGVVAGYEYNVNPKLNVGLRLNYGLLDVTNNAYFGTDSFDNNVQMRVYLTFTPFQF